MAAGFDPYHRWLSIPPSEQPANHYRLLGVAAYEANVEVIQNAAERQSRHVRSHLRTPLGAHAINLIREIEVARLCLIHPESKNAYDACLMQREALGSTRHQAPASLQDVDRRPVPWPSVEATAPAESPFSPSTFTPSIATGSKYRDSRRKSSPLAVLLMWFASGSIGLLGGYAVLCLIDPQYDFLHVMFRDDRRTAEHEQLASSASQPVFSDVRSTPLRSAVPLGSKPRDKDSKVAARTDIADVDSPAPAIPRDTAALGEGAIGDSDGKPMAALPAVDDIHALTIPFDLKKRVLRVASTQDTLVTQGLLCNVHGSAELKCSPVIDLPLGETREVHFRIGMNDTLVGMEVSFADRGKLVVVEIRPKYKLPSGDEEALYRVAGVKKANVLSRRVSAAVNAKQAIPTMQLRLSGIQSAYNAVWPVATTPTTAGRSLSQAAAQLKLRNLSSEGAALEGQILKAESLCANLPQLQVDLSAIQELGEWGAGVSTSATLKICIHRDGKSMIAEAK